MRELLDQSLEQGAIGMSSGLFYAVANAASTDEVAEVAKPLGKWGGVYTAHMRDEGDDILKSMDETFEIGRRAGAEIIVSHHKCSGRSNFGRMKETLPKFSEAMKQQEIAFDVYPYVAGSTILRTDMLERADKVLITWSDKVPGMSGRDLKEIAQEMGCSMREAADRLQPAGAIYFMMDEKDVQSAMAHPGAMIGSDGIPFDTHPHPRLWGTFPRVLGHYSRDLKLFPLEDAVRRMTSYSAQRFHLAKRGEVKPGYLCRHLRVRSGDGDRHRDLREADLAGEGHRHGAVQRRHRLARRQARRRPLRPRSIMQQAAGARLTALSASSRRVRSSRSWRSCASTRQRGDRTGLEALQRDRLAGLLAVAVGALLDRLQRRVDLGDQLAEAITGTQLERTVGLGGGAIGKIGLRQALFLHVLQCLVRFLDQLALPLQQLLTEVLLLHRVHERLAVRRPVILRQRNRHRRQLHSQRLHVRLGGRRTSKKARGV